MVALLATMLVSPLVACDRDADSAPPAEGPEAGSESTRETVRTRLGEGAVVEERGDVETEIPAAPPIVPVDGAPASFAELVRRVQPAVVNIYTTQVMRQQRRVRAPYGFGAPPRVRESTNLGSGFIFDERGYILTNSHVIIGADRVHIRTHDGIEIPAQIVGTDPLTDIAVIRVEPFEGMSTLPLGDSSRAQVGDWTLAVGNPFGLNSTVTAGILSARGRRDVQLGGRIRYVDFLQTDASINPGNSGGPLVAMNGTAIGINTAVNREGQGIGFAIPIDMVREIVGQLVDRGVVARSWIGVFIEEVDAGAASLARLDEERGALVTHVAQGGPAALAGIRPGDVILRFGSAEIQDSNELPWLASTAGVGTEVPIEIARGDGRDVVTVVMGALPE